MKWLTLLFLSILCACTTVSPPGQIATPGAGAFASPVAASAQNSSVTEAALPPLSASTPNLDCKPLSIVLPTLPAIIPSANELDETTGLHMTGNYQQIKLETYRLKVSGKVNQALSLNYDELRCLPKVTATADLVCPGVFKDRATWSGVSIVEILKLAGILADIKKVALVSADGYQTFIPAEDAIDPKNFLAYEMEGKPLPILHGFPLRAVFPGQVGGWWLKWLVEIIVS
jgi:DMSO/TMAO reductase YedYZ molybdopterin-dependent catalytic subunit